MELSSMLRESIISATTEVLATMLDVAVTLRGEGSAVPEGGGDDRVVAIVGLTGKLTGSGAIGCSPKLAAELAGKMMMQEYSLDGPSMHNEILDAIGEIANMIVGGVKTQLEDHFGLMGMSVPTVIYGHNFKIRNSAIENLYVWFDCCDDRLEVCVGLVEQPATHVVDHHAASVVSLLPR